MPMAKNGPIQGAQNLVGFVSEYTTYQQPDIFRISRCQAAQLAPAPTADRHCFTIASRALSLSKPKRN